MMMLMSSMRPQHYWSGN